MLLSKRYILASGVALLSMAGVVAVAAASGSDRNGYTAKVRGSKPVTVDAPFTNVEAGRRTRVDAPFTNVDVNPDRRRVRVQAPFADVDVRW
jgi:hypothetical protein